MLLKRLRPHIHRELIMTPMQKVKEIIVATSSTIGKTLLITLLLPLIVLLNIVSCTRSIFHYFTNFLALKTDGNFTQDTQCCESDTPVKVSFQDTVAWGRRGIKRSTNHPAKSGPLFESNITLKSKKKRPSIDKNASDKSDDSCDSSCWSYNKRLDKYS